MRFPNLSPIDPSAIEGMGHLGDFISSIQLDSGAIPSNEDGSHDPWDHLESVMGLATLGFKNEAKKGLEWMKRNQNDDGSWFNLYKDTQPLERGRQSNFSTYLAVATWHFYLLNNDVDTLEYFWEPIKKSITFALYMQNENGAIAWNLDSLGTADEDYLLTGCSSIAKSLECAIAISQILNQEACQAEWKEAHTNLIQAIENPGGVFDLTKDRSRFSMDWYYPILSGAVLKHNFELLTSKLRNTFWVKGIGIKCVSDEPWVTVAETSECSIAYKKLGDDVFAKELLQNAVGIVDQRGVPYMGWQYKEQIYWPEENPAWTSAACILAADANNNLTNASSLFLTTQFKS